MHIDPMRRRSETRVNKRLKPPSIDETVRAMTRQLTLLVVCSSTLAGCGGGGAGRRDVYAVGGYVGVGSVWGPARNCSYEATPASSLDGNTLVGPGQVTRICADGKRETFEVLASTGAKIHRIDGDDGLPLEAGGAAATFRAIPVAGSDELTSDGNFTVIWTTADDCKVSVTTDADMPAGGDSLRGSYTIKVVPKVTGTCTLSAEVVGQKATQKIVVK